MALGGTFQMSTLANLLVQYPDLEVVAMVEDEVTQLGSINPRYASIEHIFRGKSSWYIESASDEEYIFEQEIGEVPDKDYDKLFRHFTKNTLKWEKVICVWVDPIEKGEV